MCILWMWPNKTTAKKCEPLPRYSLSAYPGREALSFKANETAELCALLNPVFEALSLLSKEKKTVLKIYVFIYQFINYVVLNMGLTQ
jgi:hypothetical protein